MYRLLLLKKIGVGRCRRAIAEIVGFARKGGVYFRVLLPHRRPLLPAALRTAIRRRGKGVAAVAETKDFSHFVR